MSQAQPINTAVSDSSWLGSLLDTATTAVTEFSMHKVRIMLINIADNQGHVHVYTGLVGRLKEFIFTTLRMHEVLKGQSRCNTFS